MKVEKTSSSPATSVGESSSRNTPAKTSGAKAPPAQTESTSVHLGSTSAQLLSMGSSVASTSIVDTMKVAEIKQAISEGRFQVNSGVVADKLINTVRDLISASGH